MFGVGTAASVNGRAGAIVDACFDLQTARRRAIQVTATSMTIVTCIVIVMLHRDCFVYYDACVCVCDAVCVLTVRTRFLRNMVPDAEIVQCRCVDDDTHTHHVMMTSTPLGAPLLLDLARDGSPAVAAGLCSSKKTGRR